MQMGIEIVPYADQHFDGVKALWREAFPDDPPHRATIPHNQAIQPDLLLVAVEGKRVIGSVFAGFDGFRGWLYRVSVLRTHRRLGVGTKLIDEAEERLKLLGCKKINLQIVGSNDGVTGFYRRLGYSVEERVSMGKRVDRPSE